MKKDKDEDEFPEFKIKDPKLVTIAVSFYTYDDDGSGNGLDSVERIRRTLETHPTLNIRLESCKRIKKVF